MDYVQFLKIDPSGAGKLAESLREIAIQAEENFSTPEAGNALVEKIMPLFHDAFSKDNAAFVGQVFFEAQRAIRRTHRHQKYIYEELDRLKADEDSENNQVRMVNLYRSIVSDMLDVYLSIIVACLKMIEGKFSSFLEANLSSSELTKYQFALKRLQHPEILKGYFPIIRNAASHVGTHSIDYEQEHIIFKKIGRSAKPEIKEVLKVGNGELMGYVHALIDLTTSIDVCMNIFGLDAVNFIVTERNIRCQYADKLASAEAFEAWRKRCEEFYLPVWADSGLDEAAKWDHFSGLFAKECRDRQLPAKQISFRKDEMLLIDVPKKEIDITSEQALVNRSVELIRYALMAEPLFHLRVSSYVIAEIGHNKEECLQAWIKGKDLKDYSLRKANLYDLLNDGNFFRNEENLNIYVDFKALDEISLKSFEPFRRGRNRD